MMVRIRRVISGVCRILAAKLQFAVIIIEFPEHPFALIVAQSRALGRPLAIAKLIDRPEIALAVRVVVLVESVYRFR